MLKFNVEFRLYSTFFSPRLPKRLFSASRVSCASHDQSTIDFAYFPQEELDAPEATSVIRVPILPNNYSARNGSGNHEPMVESITRPEILTVSANGTHIDNPSAMSDVVDNHAADIDHYDLTKHVANAANKAVNTGTEHVDKQEGMRESLKTLWDGLLGDIFGGKKSTHV